MPASGATPWAKEDLKTERYLIQHKEVQAGTKSHTLRMAELEQLRRNAIDEGIEPMYMIDHVDSGRRWVMITTDEWEWLRSHEFS